jgi:biopolymer transport protein ExbB
MLIIKTVLLIFFILLLNFILSAESINEAIIKSRKELNSISQKNSEQIKEISKKRNVLSNELRDLRTKLHDKKEVFSDLKNRNKQIETIILELKKEKTEKEYETTELLNSINERTNDLYTILQTSITSGQYQEDITKLRELVSENAIPDKEHLSYIFKFAVKEIDRNRLIEEFQGEYYNAAGNLQNGKIIRIGQLVSLFNNESGEYGYLSYIPSSKYYYELQIESDRFVKRTLKKFFNSIKTNQGSAILPVDITGEVALQQMRIKKSFMDYIKSGGVIVYPILAIGIFSLIIVIERIITLNRLHTKSDKLTPELIKTIKTGDWEGAEKVCFNLPGAVSRVCLTGLKHKDMNKRVLEDVLQEAILKELPVLERNLSTLKIFAAIAPLLGLLGTVTGMIGTFDVISVFGTSDPRMMSGGISEALITTKLGLIVAVPILLLHNFLASRVSHIVNDMEKNAVTLVNILELRKERNNEVD